jgi:hypothetical protein
MAQQMKIAVPFLKYVFTLIFILGILIVVGGIYLAYLNYSSQTTFEIWGIRLSTMSVGIASILGGVIMIVLSLKKILGTFEKIGKLGSDK